ncbi:hypothetical protein THMIRHAM_08640 [Thiomicrorhabdus immobilis]|uniref:BPL/LPL catalytic domain-containing protein n=1 Tax=Thiomicrorhabdus immobilis TaxID=2791037 RepID=A0ABM7MCE0_9GAMM|nr:biotin--[acetyl-CoA-carboxylase] ligase [Thiomicrorhabdus immobilis]BCN93079.1 hypothetical protein THMIRHAM_08640 [Thiomicrorhabdus immobilis]
MPTPYEIIRLESVDSTSRYLKDYVSEHLPNKPIFCTTQNQTAGYGQQKRQWITNEKSAIFSFAFPLDKNYQLTGLVSLHIAALLHQCLVELSGDKLFLKWPNDIFNQNGKVAGMLIEQVIKKDYRAFIIGIGINRNSTELSELINTSSSMSDFDILELFEIFYQKIQQSQLQNYTFAELSEYWQTNDLFLINEPIRLISKENDEPTSSISEEAPSNLDYELGVYLGFNAHGQAIVDINGQPKLLSSGQISIRKFVV